MTAESLANGIGEPHRVDAPRCALGESPRWGHGRWWWVDASAGVVWSAASDFTNILREFVAGERISLVLPARGGRVVVACGHDLVTLDAKTHDVKPWARVELDSGWVLNDGTVDDYGRVWIGSVHPRRAPRSGLIHRIDRDGSVTTSHTGTQLSNGMAWTSQGHLLHADSITRSIFSRRVGTLSGRVVSSSVAWKVPEVAGIALPDGLSSDEEDGVWVALYGAGKVVRVIDGRAEDTIAVPTAQTTSVSLGGIDGRDLLITTAQEGMNEEAIIADQNAGALFRARVRVPGVRTPLVRVD